MGAQQKRSGKNKKTAARRQVSFNDIVIAIFLAVAVAVVPTIVRIREVAFNADEQLVRGNGSVYEAFTYYKSTALLIAGVCICLFFIACVCIGDIKLRLEDVREPVFVASAVYVFFVILSTLFSDYKQMALNGFSDRHESVFILIVYIVLFFTARSFIKTGLHARAVLVFFIISALVIGIIGAFQAFGRDIFDTAFGNRMVLGKELYDEYYESGGLQVRFKDQVYTTLFNPNCVGLFACLLIPVFTASVFYFKHIFLKILSGITAVLAAICLVGSKSQAGYIGFIAVVLVCAAVGVVYFLRFHTNKMLKTVCIYAGAGILAAALICAFVQREQLSAYLTRILNLDGNKQEFFVYDMEYVGDGIRFDTRAGSFYIQPDGDFMFGVRAGENERLIPVHSAASEDGKLVEYAYDLSDIGYLTMQIRETSAAFKIGGLTLFVYLSPDGRINIYDPRLNAVDRDAIIPRIGFKNAERFASSRGYIWSRALPVFFKSVIIGSGPESFALVFPQGDVVGKVRNFGEPYMLIDKAHNFYLQTGITTGVISLCALLFIFIYYIATAFKSLTKEKTYDIPKFLLTLGVLAGVCGYLVCSLSTDSAVSTAPLFWAALGFGFGLKNSK